MAETSWCLILLTLLTLIIRTDQNARQKRQILPDLPRIVTENGHLIFHAGVNHNITFRSGTGGIFVDNLDLKDAVTQTKTNQEAIVRLLTSLGSGNATNRFTSLEDGLRRISGLTLTVDNLSNVASGLRTQVEETRNSFNIRLTHVEAQVVNVQNISAIQTTVTRLRNRVRNLENTLPDQGGSGDNGGDGSDGNGNGGRGGNRRGNRQLRARISALEETVRNLQALLTTNECLSNPCLNGGTCVDVYNGYLCRCPPNWQGPRCTEDVNECYMYAGTDMGCQNGATCINSPGSFRCQCTTDWYGVHCSEQHNDCTGASHMELCGHGTCVNEDRIQPGQPRYRCICENGWTRSTSGPACTVDIDECATATHCSVDPPVQCINIPGSFVCGSCPLGYTGNGYACYDINECAINNGGCSTTPRVECVNTRGSRACGPCPAGYQGNGISCNYVGLCSVNNGGCHPLATCSETSGLGNICSCPNGYVGSGVGPSGCQQQSQAGGCASNPCQNGAVCAPVGSTGFTCACRPGFSGPTCSVVVDACLSNPCQNGGTCLSQTQTPGYSCQCTENFTGTNCQQAQQECGGYLRGQTGSFSYPRTTGTTYPHRVSCAWVISTNLNKVLTVTFPRFSLEDHPECNFDFLQIHDGPTPSSHMIGKYCGTNPPNGGHLNSTHNQLYFWFKSDASRSSEGFEIRWTSHPPTCGGYLNSTDHGAINSPGYPGNYPNNRDCAWTVAVSPGSNILFTFAHLALEQHPNCSFDYLEIRDGELDDAPLIRRFCSSDSPAPIQTTGPYAYIRFHSDFSLSDRGFHITYAALTVGRQGCGGALSGPEGEVMSPEYPSTYRHDIQCVWVITVAPGSSVQLSFLDFDLETSTSCVLDYLTIRDGSDQMAPIINTLCGTELPATIVSSSNIISIELHTDESISGRGFKATWTTACGGTFSDLQGQIQSPNWPEFYPHNRECDYRIEVPDLHTIRFQFTAFGLEGDDDCAYDYIEIYDGANQNSPLMGSRLCGNTSPPEIMSTGSELFIRFVTDGSVNNHGFQATYTAVEGGVEGCGGVLNTASGVITSPGHPNVYPHGVNCTWYINVTPGLVIRLTFHAFSFENPRINTCLYDYVDIYDNSTIAEESRLGRYCGSLLPGIVTSTDNVLVVYMQTDSSVAREGFSASYIAINTSTTCGSALMSASGVITSPNYPQPYPHNRQCEWTITAADGNQIFLNITDLDLENHPNCNFDFLEIRNGGYLTSPLMHKFCGQLITSQPLLSHSNRLYLRFTSDISSSGRGFRLEYTSGTSGCGGDLTTPTGAIVSPNYPQHYSHNAQCYWSITVSQGSSITLFFVDFDIEDSSQCYYDYLEVRDDGPSGRSLGRFCGSTIPNPITSGSNRLWLTYNSDAYVAGRGFRLQYHGNCNMRLTGNRGVIESPNFPNPYHHRTNCTWIIEVPMGNTINVSFAAFRLEDQSQSVCHFDRLQIRDGGDNNARELTTVCGTSIPEPLHSTGNLLWLNFVTDTSIAHDGFRLEWLVDGCGGNLYGSTGIITSPNYPNPYPHRIECHWVITVDTGSSIQVTITDFNLENSGRCWYDMLEIYAGSDASGPRLTQLCHRQTQPQILHTTGTTAFVRFRSDASSSRQGFRLTYTAVSGGCGGNFTARTATITSINYPQNYEHSTECEWNITVVTGHVVVLNFTDFDVEDGSSCDFDYVNLYDGPNANATLIASLCGHSLGNNTLYRSNGNQMFVRMRTDSSVTHRGFSATYTTGCGGRLNADTDGEIFSPGYPGQYLYNTHCVWIISSSLNNQRVSLTFTHMDLHSSEGCTYEYVSVNDGLEPLLNRSGVLQNQYCGTSVPATIMSEGSALTVVFQSYYYPGTGFRAVYSSTYSVCGVDLTAQSGRFTSPNYPDGYPVSTECVWNIRSSPGNQLQISFLNFELDPLGDVNDDYVEIRSPNVSGAIVGRWIRNNPPENLTSLSGAWVKFRSNEDTTAPGFVAEYSTSYGGNLVGDSGQIASPQYPGFYPRSSDYRWTVLASQGMRIHVSFSHFSLERQGRDGTCYFDHVEIFDGTQEDGVSLGIFCDRALPSPVYSESNQITVVFTSDDSVQDTGFLLNWLAVPASEVPTPSVAPTTPVPGCGGQLVATDTRQNITSPGYPADYPNSIHCSWTISVPEGHTVVVNITSIDLETHGSCYFDYLRFLDGPGSYHRIIGTYCGRTRNTNLIRSTGSSMSITFHTDYSATRPGFVLTYEIGCGGSLRSPTGVIKSLGYPNNYPANQNCTWIVNVLPGKTIRLDFDAQFNIADSGECNNDYLMLLNGYTAHSPPLLLNGTTNTNGRYCGSSKPEIMETSSNFLFANFVSDGSNQETGFSLTYSAVSVACGGQLRLTDAVTSGYFMSPNYPENYPHNVDCVWVIIVPASKRIRVDFEGNFSIEGLNSCYFDYVEFHDGGTTNSPRIGNRICGTTLPGTVLSTGNVMLARFQTDNSVPHAGFKAKYSIATCGGHITAANGVITSPNFPANYGNNLDCEWTLTGPVGHFLRINITYLRLQQSPNCTADFVEIRDGNATDSILYQACGFRSPSSFETSDSVAYIRFRSDASVTNTGFHLVFLASVEECGGQLNTPTGVITSPNYPNQYPHRRSCVWDITVPEGRSVTLTFNDLRLEGTSSRYCGYWDFVEAINGHLLGSPSLGRFCGNTVPAQPVESSGNTMRVRFRTDGSISNVGFRATYTSDREAECGGYITEGDGNITSPGYDNRTYNHNIQCIWRFNTHRENSSIRLYFTHVSIEHEASCTYDYVEIREGTDVNAPLVKKYCGNSSYTFPVVIPGNHAWIRFVSDMSVSHGGFQLMYQFKECGGVFSDSEGVITSPNYPSLYEDHVVGCAWKIVAPEGTRIRVNFTDFYYYEYNDCYQDNLQIQNGGLPDSPVIDKYCGNKRPGSFLSQSNELRLSMQSFYSTAGRKFRMEYRFESEGCGGLFHNNRGSLSSPNYPSSYPHNTECRWDITVEAGYIINLHFNPPFDLEARNCSNDHVEVFDVLTNGTLVSLGRWCHNIEPPDQRSSSTRLVVVFQSDATTNGNGFSASWDVVCGGVFTDPSGELFSPGYPNLYPNNIVCNYSIAPGSERHIALRFYDFELEGGYSCQHDSLQVWQGNMSTADTQNWWMTGFQRHLGTFCGRTMPDVILAVSEMSIKFRTDPSLQYKGFHAQYYSEECGGVFTNPTGMISTPIHPNNYLNNMNCSWNITVMPDRIIRFKFYAFETEVHPRCLYDHVTFYDGADTNARMIGRYCGNLQSVPEYIESTGNQMYISFITDSSQTSDGFVGSYWTTYGPAHGCGGVLRQSNGTITSLDIDGDWRYEHNLHCTWLIFVNDNKVVTITIDNIDLESGYSRCGYDYLNIYDGLTTDDPLLGSHCGNTAPDYPILASSNVVFVVFHTDSSVAAAGFNVTFTETNDVCGGASYNATSIPQTLTSPNYPNSTATAVRCSWIIDSGDTFQQVRLHVTDLQLQATNDCHDEYLNFRDRPMGTNGQEHFYCGNTIPHPFDSKGAQVKITYNLATTSNSRGFQLTYQIADCNQNISLASGRITSPRFPDVYPKNSDCTIRVTSPDNTTLALYFNSFQMEVHSRCQYDFLEIKNSSSATVAKLCGSVIPSPIFMTDNVATLRFVTDDSVQRFGYDITFLSSTQGPGCGGNITGLPTGVFTSPGYPGSFSEPVTCSWYIHPPARRPVWWKVSIMNTPDTSAGSDNCASNYVAIYTGLTDTSTISRQYCASDQSYNYPRISDSPFLVRYVSSSNSSAPVFKFEFSTSRSRYMHQRLL